MAVPPRVPRDFQAQAKGKRDLSKLDTRQGVRLMSLGGCEIPCVSPVPFGRLTIHGFFLAPSDYSTQLAAGSSQGFDARIWGTEMHKRHHCLAADGKLSLMRDSQYHGAD